MFSTKCSKNTQLRKVSALLRGLFLIGVFFSIFGFNLYNIESKYSKTVHAFKTIFAAISFAIRSKNKL